MNKCKNIRYVFLAEYLPQKAQGINVFLLKKYQKLAQKYHTKISGRAKVFSFVVTFFCEYYYLVCEALF